MVVEAPFWLGKRVLLTGHTGFKGGWLALWLQQLGAEVYGFALAPDTEPNLYEAAQVADGMHSQLADIRDLEALRHCFQSVQPEIVLHLAAKPLVRQAYKEPLETYQVNLIGSMHVLECIRQTASVQSAVLITTDKCYENKGWYWPYRENDALGGHDPYSSSKACMEIMVDSYRRSYFADHKTAIATARSGNVIGGGDWSADRLIPDLVRATQHQQTLRVRNPDAVRPWQHVLDPLAGYLCLAQRLYQDGERYAQAWNFGPEGDAAYSVGWIIQQVQQFWPDLNCQLDTAPQPHEAGFLTLDCSKAKRQLQWHARWDLPKALDKTLSWYQLQHQGGDVRGLCHQQIAEYMAEDRNTDSRSL